MKNTKRFLVTIGVAGILALTACATPNEPTETIASAAPEIDLETEMSPDYGFDIYNDTGGALAIPGGPALLSPEEIDAFWASMFDPETVQIIINDEVIEAPTPFADSQDGTVMLPLISIAEALGYTVIDEGEEVIIAPGTIVTAGVNSYYRGREMARELTSAPVMHEGVMFVPWEFFGEILSSVAYIEDGNIMFAPVEWDF